MPVANRSSFHKKTESLQKQNTLKIPLDFTRISVYNVYQLYTFDESAVYAQSIHQTDVRRKIYDKTQKGMREDPRFFTLKLCDLVY